VLLPKECKESWAITAGEMRAVTITVCACVLMCLHCFYRLRVERLVNLRYKHFHLYCEAVIQHHIQQARESAAFSYPELEGPILLPPQVLVLI